MTSGLARCRRAAPESGAAVVEVAVLGVVLLVPLVYLLLSVFQTQQAASALTASAREAARVFVDAPSERDGWRAATAAVDVAAVDHGLPLNGVSVRIDCTSTPCLTPGATVAVRLETRVGLPGLAALGTGAAAVVVRTEHSAVVDRFRPVRP